MPEIQIRLLTMGDLPLLIQIDHSYISESVWQIEVIKDNKGFNTQFREVKLPRVARQKYPRNPNDLADTWKFYELILVAECEGEAVGYLCANRKIGTGNLAIEDLVVTQSLRRKGVGKALMMAAQEWGVQKNLSYVIAEMQSKNTPMISLVTKLGFNFIGYCDHYFPNHDIAIFFGKTI